MKKTLVILFIFLAAKVTAQNNDYRITMNGIGAVKLGMKQPELEKMFNKKFKLKNIPEANESYYDTVKVKYKNIDLDLYLEKWFNEDSTMEVGLMGIRTTSPLCKTATGIGIGADKMRIIAVYENNPIVLAPEFEDDTYTKLSKTRSTISVSSYNEDGAILFYLTNKKVTAIEVFYSYGD